MLRAFRKSWARASKAARHGANSEGTAAVEFALLLPILITLFFGVVESSLALLCRADVSLMASTAGDLISQTKAATTTDISNVYSAAGTLLYPYYDPSQTGSAKPTIRITSVVDDGSGAATGNHLTGKVAWSCTQSGSGTLTWQHVDDPRVVEYRVAAVAQEHPGGDDLPAQPWVTVARPTGGCQTMTTTVTGLVSGRHYVFWLDAVITNGVVTKEPMVGRSNAILVE